jgi:hypothetical protein
MKHFQDLSSSVSGLQNLAILVIEFASLNAFEERNKTLLCTRLNFKFAVFAKLAMRT